MPVVQGLGAYSIGRDCTVVIVHPLAPGGRVDISNVTGFSAKQQETQLTAKRLDGNRLSAYIPEGWNGSFDVDRNGPAIDNLVALIEAAWRTGGTLYAATVFQYINEPNGQVTQWQFSDVALSFPDLGTWHSDEIVKQNIAFMANRRLAV
jgi:hypothetical protein